MQTMLVAGDVLYDVNLLSLPASTAGHAGALPAAVAQRVAGGAWHLARMARLACQALDSAAIVIAEPSPSAEDSAQALGLSVAQAFSIWSPHPRLLGSRERVWRIERLLGCQPGRSASAPADPGLDDPKFDALILDDLNLGFRSNPGNWEALLARCTDNAPIVLKTAGPVGDGPLWTALMARYADRLTVVLDAASLRRRHALISEGLSWDRTIEEFEREFAEGLSARDLAQAQRVVVLFGTEGAGIVGRKGGRPELEHFVYDPEQLEDTWRAARPGATLGATTILAAVVARCALDPLSYPPFVAAGRALAAMRASHDAGAGSLRGAGIQAMLDSFDADAGHDGIARAFHPTEAPTEASGDAPPERAFRSAFPHDSLHRASGTGDRSDLLRDLTGDGYEYVATKAVEVVLEGMSPALDTAPKARYGALVTVDREEIERLNEVRRLVLAYAASEADHRPLSLAVFGPPGSGKSFAIKQLASALFGGRAAALEFNLSQFRARDELPRAFDLVRDASIKGQLPLVFWDEFDSDGLSWLSEFLAPMQDAEYRDSNGVHPFGKAIFVFAGGTCSSFQAFDRSSAAGEEGVRFRSLKGPDFVSRLRGYVNIKGPNPVSQDPGDPAPAGGDVAHLIRRAILLRSLLERLCPDLIDPVTGAASMSPSVIGAFLRAQAFHHGARSVEALVRMSALAGAEYFGVAELPSADLLHLHVTPDFATLVQGGELELATIDQVAAAMHEGWRAEREKQGWRWGATRDDAAKIHPLLVSYAGLTEAETEANRTQARMTLAKLHQIGYRIVPLSTQPDQPAQPTNKADSGFTAEERSRLIELEHESWLRDHLLHGYAYAEETNERLRLHRNVAAFDRLSEEDTALDAAIVDSLPVALKEVGYRLVRVAASETVATAARG